MKKRLSEFHPFLYHVRIFQKRITRKLSDFMYVHKFSRIDMNRNDFHFPCVRHQSLLRRKLGSSDPKLQENKIRNLEIAAKQVSSTIIKPGQIFSFWHLVGKPKASRGYIEGMLLSRGEVITGIGGGLCQLANLIYWMSLHTPLKVIERHHHSFDPFPDEGRTLPFGSGASVFYNYVDLRLMNPTNQEFQITISLSDKHLKGAIFTTKEWPYTYHIEEENHRFIEKDHTIYRQNEIWRKKIDKKTGNVVEKILLIQNFSEVKYNVEDSLIERI